jgi:hypothetical protein
MMTKRIISSILLVASVASAQTPYNVELYPYTGASINFGTIDNSNIYIGSRFSPYFGFEAGYMSFKTKESFSHTPGKITERVIRMQDHAVQHDGIPVLGDEDEIGPLFQNGNTYESDDGEEISSSSKKSSEEHKQKGPKTPTKKGAGEDLSKSTDSFVFADKSGTSSPAMSSPGKPTPGKPKQGEKSPIVPSKNPSPLSMESGFGTENAEVLNDNIDWNHGANDPQEHPAEGEGGGDGNGYQEIVIREQTAGVAHLNTTKVYGPYLNATLFFPVCKWECSSFEVFSSIGISFLTLKSTQEPFFRHHRGEVKTLVARKAVPKVELGGIYMFGGSVGLKGSVGWINTKKLGKLQDSLEYAAPIRNTTYFGAGILWRF